MEPNSQAYARQLDEQDPLKRFRKEFLIPVANGREQIYFLGNSLGLQPKRTAARLQQVLEQWSRLGVEGFFTGELPWLQYHDLLTAPLASIVGALPHEVVVMNQLTVNLHLMLVSFYRPSGSRNKILCEAKAFPSDQYMLETHVRSRGLSPEEIILEVAPRPGETLIRTEDFLEMIERYRHELALVFCGGVNYYTGQVFDMEVIAAAARSAGACVGFDLAHAAGNIPTALHRWGVDFACWCSYKYLNSGPGAVAGAFVHERHHADKSLNRFAGWWGYRKDRQFLMEKGFDPEPSAGGWQLSTPAPLLYAAHLAALEIFEEAGLENIFEKGRQLSDYLRHLLSEACRSFPEPPFQILTPEKEKGCQISLYFPSRGKPVFDHLSRNGIFADWREPGVIRVAPVPLYNTFEEVWQFVQALKKAVGPHPSRH